MGRLLDRVAAFVSENGLWLPGAKLLVAVSGGPDSLALLHLLKELQTVQDIVLHVAHLDHGLRDDSAADASYVAGVARAWALPITISRRDVRMHAAQRGGVEAAARAVRYGFLRETALAVGAGAVVTGHTADDQAETVIQRLLRGAGPGGLAGIRPLRRYGEWCGIGTPSDCDAGSHAQAGPDLVRPLLSTRHNEVEAYCVQKGLYPRYDSTNLSSKYLRNRVRGYIIPVLKAYNSNIVGALGRTARIAADEDALLVELLDQAWPNLVTVSASGVWLDRTVFVGLHTALRRRALRRAASLLVPGAELGADHLDRMLKLAVQTRGRLQLPGGLWMRTMKQGVMLERWAN